MVADKDTLIEELKKDIARLKEALKEREAEVKRLQEIRAKL